MRTWKKTGSAALLVALLVALAWPGAAAAKKPSLTLVVRPATVPIGDQFQARVAVDGSLRRRPQLQGAEAFDILGTSVSKNVQFINGALTVQHEYVFTLRALKKGKFNLVAAARAPGGQVQSAPVPVTVVGGRAMQPPAVGVPPAAPAPTDGGGEDYFIDARVNNARPIVGQLVIVEYHLYLAPGVEPVGDIDIVTLPDFVDFTSHELPKSNRLDFTEVSVGGRTYRAALVRRYAVFPTSAGDKALGTMALRFSVVGGNDQRRGNDPFGFMMPMFRDRQVAQAQSRPAKITVQPLPTEGRPLDFAGAVGQVKITAELDRDQAPAGEPITLRLTISGEGNIETIKRPKLNLPAGLRVYNETNHAEMAPNLDTITGTKTFEIILIGEAPGEFEIPALTLPYFDPAGGAYAEATTAARRVTITGEAVAASNGKIPVLTRETVELRGRDLRYIRPDRDTLRGGGAPWFAATLVWMLLGLWALLVGVVLALQVQRGRLLADRGVFRSRRAMKEARQRLAAARKLAAGEPAAFFAELHNAILGFVADKFDTAAAGLELHEAQALLRKAGIGEPVVERFARLWREADAARFGGGHADEAARHEAFAQARRLLAELGEELTR